MERLHLLNILIHLGHQKASYYRLARRIIKRLFTANAVAAFIAFSTLLEWVDQEFSYWQGAKKWQPHIRLAMVWAHTHHLFSILTAVGVPLDWISETFRRIAKRLPPEMFNRDLAQWFDVAHPRQLNFPAFTLMGLAYSVGERGTQVFDQVLEENFTFVAFREVGDVILPVAPLFRDISRASNTLASFLGGNYAENLVHLFGKDRARAFDSEVYQALASQALDALAENPNDLSAWPILQVTVADLPPYDSLANNLSQLLVQTQFVNLIDQDKKAGLAVIKFAAMQLIHLANEDLKQHLNVQFMHMVEQLPQQDWGNPSTQIADLDSIYLSLV